MIQDPIAVFDSGLGGLTVVQQLLRHLPNERIVYFGDTARVPYGIKSAETVTRFVEEDIDFLLGFDPKLIVAACNTASATALPRLRNRYAVPILGVVEPGAAAAISRTRNFRIGVIGTEATIGSESYTRCIMCSNPSAQVFAKACPLLVPMVEEGRDAHDPLVLMALAEYLQPLKDAGIDTLVLGCTHYPLLKPGISDVLGEGVAIVDSATQTAVNAVNLLHSRSLQATAASDRKRPPARVRHRFFASDHPERFAALGRRFLGQALESVELVQPELMNGRCKLKAVGLTFTEMPVLAAGR